ncbi:MAG TPA: ORF6N domain-containing protein [Ferruginibacter sp.]|nr:ORF6N domain-containing protein [Ferruginibacter sp.]
MKAQIIQDSIYEVRGERVMLDFDLAKLYSVETRIFNQAVKRNGQSFPKDFMFRLTAKEWKEISSSQIVMMDNLPKNRTGRYLPYAFTEHGVTMVASILKSPKARKMNIAIVRAFIALKRFANKNAAILHLVKELKDRIDEHDVQLSSIYDALENMLDEKEDEKVKKIGWEERERIGFKK